MDFLLSSLFWMILVLCLLFLLRSSFRKSFVEFLFGDILFSDSETFTVRKYVFEVQIDTVLWTFNSRWLKICLNQNLFVYYRTLQLFVNLCLMFPSQILSPLAFDEMSKSISGSLTSRRLRDYWFAILSCFFLFIFRSIFILVFCASRSRNLAQKIEV